MRAAGFNATFEYNACLLQSRALTPRPLMNPFTAALQDWSTSARLVPLWSNLALDDLRDRYRRTVLGLAWIVASFALFVAVKVFVFGQLTNVSAEEFGVYVTLGFGLWTYINAMVVDACTAYMHSRPWILGTSTPYPVFLLQAVFRNWLIFGMILLVMAIALAWKTTPWTMVSLSVVPALLVYALTSLWLAAILAPLCARYRDLFHTVQTSMRLIFFATPILWIPATSGRLMLLAQLNPISHFVAIVRDPLMYNRLPATSWWVVLAINALGLAAGIVVYAMTRRRIAHWV
jgi:ABC-type polysaccharide/polyol phosphate export permease